ncbi:hypothetical protein AK830_g7038 [Neonectria ditissima]|uniref:RelA/SpoT domain-containing protein n=1 Tax=Neonectria ditissima TaxID=78410 RepID=A0A0P7B0L0_9HYPO|nr:hypothetical protein AK830_g7038 [Neonectria ditissima]
MAASLITEFVTKYQEHHRSYVDIATEAENECRKLLEENGIRAIITSRAKAADRVATKLNNRMEEKKYESFEDIRKDLVDLAGVRVALYFPSQEPQVVELLRTRFNVDKVIVHPSTVNTPVQTPTSDTFPHDAEAQPPAHPANPKYANQFAGYRASHLRVNLKEKDSDGTEIELQNGTSAAADGAPDKRTVMIEIQVASLLMHAWSEVNHDLAYKTLNGIPSNGELRILDGINGLVRTGEVLLGQLQMSVEERMANQNLPFLDSFELRAFIRRYAPAERVTGNKYRMGAVQWLYDVCKHLGLKTTGQLEPHLKSWRESSKKADSSTTVQSILDYIFDVYKQKEVNPLDSPYFKGPLNEVFNAKSLPEKIGLLSGIMAFASHFDVLHKGWTGEETIELPASHGALKRMGLLRIPENENEGGDVILTEKEAQMAVGPMKELWSWFAGNDSIQARVALGIARVDMGKDLSESLADA